MQDNFNQDSVSILTRELKPGEKLLWSGQPPRGLIFRASDITGIPISLAWAGFAVFWEQGAIRGAMHMKGEGMWLGIGLVLFGLPFVVVGLQMLVGRFVWDIYTRMHTHYGITDKRVLFARGGYSTTYMGLDRKTLRQVTIAERPDGSGTLTFEYPVILDARHTRFIAGLQRMVPLTFERIPNVREAYRILQKD